MDLMLINATNDARAELDAAVSALRCAARSRATDADHVAWIVALAAKAVAADARVREFDAAVRGAR